MISSDSCNLCHQGSKDNHSDGIDGNATKSTSNFKTLQPSKSVKPISKHDTNPFQPLRQEDNAKFQEFPPNESMSTPKKKLRRSKRIRRKLKLAKDKEEDPNLLDASTDSGAENIDDKNPNLSLLTDALAITKRSYEKCFNFPSNDKNKGRRPLALDELVTKTPSRSIWNFANETPTLIEGNTKDTIRLIFAKLRCIIFRC